MKSRVVIAAFLVLAPPQGVAAQAPGGATSGFVTVDGSRIHYEECGRGPTLVLLHDGGSTMATWDAVWPLLCARFHVVRYDRRGVGRSETPARPFAHTDDLDSLLAARRIARATLVGSSIGGAISIDYALVHPERVDRLVLVGAVVNGLPVSTYFTEEKAASMDAQEKSRRYSPALERRLPTPAVARLGEIRAPTLILVGESDIADVHSHAGAIELGIWGARREIVRKSGHLVQGDQPAVLRDRIVEFVEESPVVIVPAARLNALAGRYVSPLGQGEFVVKDDRLRLRLPGQPELPLFPSSDSTFYALIWGKYQVNFRRMPDGAMVADIIVNGKPQTTAIRARDP